MGLMTIIINRLKAGNCKKNSNNIEIIIIIIVFIRSFNKPKPCNLARSLKFFRCLFFSSFFTDYIHFEKKLYNNYSIEKMKLETGNKKKEQENMDRTKNKNQINPKRCLLLLFFLSICDRFRLQTYSR